MTKTPFGPGTIFLGGGALLLFALLGIGFLLPTHWEASASARLQAAPENVLPFVDSPEGWQSWTTWPDSGLTREGPERGPGASISWNDRELGSGTFRIETVRSNESMTYSVQVAGAGGAVMETTGALNIARDGDSVLVEWQERGDLGRNPLMGYWALSMERAQSAELSKGLDRLAAVIADRLELEPPETPADTSSTGAS